MSKHLTRERLRELLDYDPLTGLFTWKVKRNSFGGCVLPGTIAGSVGGRGCVDIRVDGKLYLAHRLAFLHQTGEFPPADVDHINGIRTDNRWSNLRPATRRENNGNHKGYGGKSGIRGVHWDKRRGKWRAEIHLNNTKISLGSYSTKEDAAQAYQFAAGLIFGQFAYHLSQPNHAD